MRDARMAMLVYADSDGVERSVTVGQQPVVVGRANECAIRSADPRVSRNHARFYTDQMGTLHIEDLGSSNGVYIGQHKVLHSAVPFNEYVVVGSLVFRLVPDAPPAPPPIAPPSAWLSPETQPAAHAYPPRGPVSIAPPLSAEPSSSIIVDESATDPVAAERKARQAAEEERDAYGARMAELHGELRSMRDLLAAQQKRVLQLEAQLGTGEPAVVAAEQRAAAALEELEMYRMRVGELTDQMKAAEAQAKAAQEELQVARADLLAAEERIVAEIAAHEQRSSAELASRVEELAVTRADLIKAEERIVDLSRQVAELGQRLAQR